MAFNRRMLLRLVLVLTSLASCGLERGALPLPAAAVALGPSTAGRPSVVVAGYELGRPLQTYALPGALRELSGIAAVGGRTVACVQDELGALFHLDLDTGQFTGAATFGPPGDYEGLARVGDALWVLRSDGQLTEVQRAADGLRSTRSLRVAAPYKDFEGLAVDLDGARLIVASKSLREGKQFKAQRALYTVDLASGATSAQPLLVLDREALLASASALGVAVPARTTAGGKSTPKFGLRLSEVAVQPDTGALWLCSAADCAVVVVARDGTPIGMHFFHESEFPQLEAATFLPSGELVLASEGVDGNALLRVYGRAE